MKIFLKIFITLILLGYYTLHIYVIYPEHINGWLGFFIGSILTVVWIKELIKIAERLADKL